MACGKPIASEIVPSVQSGPTRFSDLATTVNAFTLVHSEYENPTGTLERDIAELRAPLDDRVTWEGGEPGNGLCVPTDQEMQARLKEFGLKGIPYKEGVPDFSKVTLTNVRVDRIGTERSQNFTAAFRQIVAETEGLDTRREAELLLQQNELTWHEERDRVTMSLVPRDIHDYFSHTGGVSDAKAIAQTENLLVAIALGQLSDLTADDSGIA